MPSSLTLGCSRCLRPIDWRANPDVETTDWRARRGRTAQRVRREGTAVAVPYPYPTTLSRHTRRSKPVTPTDWHFQVLASRLVGAGIKGTAPDSRAGRPSSKRYGGVTYCRSLCCRSV
jgi:hypothetical protein